MVRHSRHTEAQATPVVATVRGRAMAVARLLALTVLIFPSALFSGSASRGKWHAEVYIHLSLPRGRPLPGNCPRRALVMVLTHFSQLHAIIKGSPCHTAACTAPFRAQVGKLWPESKPDPLSVLINKVLLAHS